MVRRPSIEHARSTVIEKAMLMELHSACMVYGGVNVRHTIDSKAGQFSRHFSICYKIVLMYLIDLAALTAAWRV